MSKTGPNYTAAKRSTKSLWIGIGLVVAVLAGGGAWAFLALNPASHQPDANAATAAPTPKATATVEQRDLVTTYVATCAVDFGDPTQLIAGLGGTVTELPVVDSVIQPGQTAYRVDDSPVTLLRGELPAWRDFVPWMEAGRDITQLKAALVDGGWADADVIGTTEKWNQALSTAIADFQEARGLDRSSRLDRGSIVFLPSQIRVASVLADLGTAAQVGQPVFNYTNPTQRLTCDVGTANRRYAVVGAEVLVELADAQPITAKIQEVATQAATSPGETDQILVTIEDAAITNQAVGDVAKVTFSHTVARDVMTVPVTALVAFTDGGFGVQRLDASGATEYVPVETGQFADTWVEVTGSGLAVGDQVVVAP